MNFALELLSGTFAICRLDPDAPIPDWATGTLVSITRTSEQLSIVCEQEQAPQDVQTERGWQCLRVAGKLDFSLVGVIATLTTTLAEAGISVFVASSYDTDFVLVRECDLEKTIAVLRQAGHTVVGQT